MSLDINSARIAQLASELAAATGEDPEGAVISALEEKLSRIPQPAVVHGGDDIDALFEHLARMPVRDARSPDEILGYDENGLPR